MSSLQKAFSEDLPLRNLLDWKAREVLIGNEPIKSKFSSFLYVGNPLGCETLEVFLRSTLTKASTIESIDD
jgi:hypothetical protein